MFTRLIISTRACLNRGTACRNNIAITLPTLTAIHHTPTRFQSSSNNDDDKSTDTTKLDIIRNWMKWNRWKYKPDMDAIANIGKSTSPLDAFRDMVPKEKRQTEPVGRSWSVRELRRKSYDDLHKLWYVLYKERNMLLTESNLSRRHGYEMVQSDRRKKVRKSMGAIKHVLGERKRAKIADHRAYLEELKRFDGLMADLNLQDDKDELEDAMHNEADEIKLDKE